MMDYLVLAGCGLTRSDAAKVLPPVLLVCQRGCKWSANLLQAVVGHSWVGVWALLITCDCLGAGVLLLWAAGVVVVVGVVTGGVGGLVGDVVLPCLGPGLLLLWVTRMVVVGGVVAAVGTSFGW